MPRSSPPSSIARTASRSTSGRRPPTTVVVRSSCGSTEAASNPAAPTRRVRRSRVHRIRLRPRHRQLPAERLRVPLPRRHLPDRRTSGQQWTPRPGRGAGVGAREHRSLRWRSGQRHGGRAVRGCHEQRVPAHDARSERTLSTGDSPVRRTPTRDRSRRRDPSRASCPRAPRRHGHGHGLDDAPGGARRGSARRRAAADTERRRRPLGGRVQRGHGVPAGGRRRPDPRAPGACPRGRPRRRRRCHGRVVRRRAPPGLVGHVPRSERPPTRSGDPARRSNHSARRSTPQLPR